MNKKIVYYDIIVGVELVDDTYTEYVVGRTVLRYHVPQEEVRVFNGVDAELSRYLSLVELFEWSSLKKYCYLRIDDLWSKNYVHVKYSKVDKIVVKRVPVYDTDFSLYHVLNKLNYSEAIEFLHDNNLSIQVKK